ncbi:hypothetical protein HFN20_25965, partial [Paenibacillus dendritiformis]|uniref:hypothetical protein n=1 Tax=Paenibacillus dendritiformis TaxID=130049 RepID=UPI00143E0C82
SGLVVPIELLYFCRISLTESACLEKSWSLRDFACRIGVPGKIEEFADFACRIGVSGKIVEFADFACRMGVSREMVQFSGWWKYPFSYSKLLSQQPETCILFACFFLFEMI